MTSDPEMVCGDLRRRSDTRASALHGFDYAEVSDDQRTIVVWFLGRAPQDLKQSNLRLAGGRRIRGIVITDFRLHRQVDLAQDDFMEVMVDRAGDFSTYTLSVVALDAQGRPTGQPPAAFDPRYASVAVAFKAACPTGLDCHLTSPCPPAPATQPDINYLAKDYTSFRQLILDRLAVVMPDWQETHVPDLGVTLVELLAYAGDQLSYFQDAVATEAYLGTARQRISVRRHARLVDYRMHEGCNARAWLAIEVDQDRSLDPTTIAFLTAGKGMPETSVLTPVDLAAVPEDSYQQYQAMVPGAASIALVAAHSTIRFHTWGDCQCCLPAGSTQATVLDHWTAVEAADGAAAAGGVAGDPPGVARSLRLQAGDVLLLEEVIGPVTGDAADADPARRQAVRLVRVTPVIDPLYAQGDLPGTPLLELEWGQEDALQFDLYLSVQAPAPGCSCLEDVSVARGNVVLVEHGLPRQEVLGIVPTATSGERCACTCTPAGQVLGPAPFTPRLALRPLSFAQPVTAGESAQALTRQDPRQALPAIVLAAIPAAPLCPVLPAPAPPCQALPLFHFDELDDPTGLAARLVTASDGNTRELLARLSPATRQALAGYHPGAPLPGPLKVQLQSDLSALLEHWTPRSDLLDAGPDERAFVVEMDDDGYGHLRFGDGRLGRQPDAGMEFRATWRTGNGPAGNVGAGAIRHLLLLREKLVGAAFRLRNPLPAIGGTAPEAVAEVKRFAPYAFRDVLERAVIDTDYATLAADNARRQEWRALANAALLANPALSAAATACAPPFMALQGAQAQLRWTGSWMTALVALDPAGREDPPATLLQETTAYLEGFRRIGHDLLVAPADYVSIDLALRVCLLPGYPRAHVAAALLDVFSNGVRSNGSLGYFHPDRLSFSTGLRVSSILAAAQAVAGVQDVTVTRLERWEREEPAPGESLQDEVPPGSVLALGPLQIPRLDNDPDFPEHGRLTLDLRGGR